MFTDFKTLSHSLKSQGQCHKKRLGQFIYIVQLLPPPPPPPPPSLPSINKNELANIQAVAFMSEKGEGLVRECMNKSYHRPCTNHMTMLCYAMLS